MNTISQVSQPVETVDGEGLTPKRLDAGKYVLKSPELLAAQRRHSWISVKLPALAVIAGPLYMWGNTHWGLGLFLFALGCAIAGCFGVTVGYHRHFAHRSFKTTSWMRALMAIAGQTSGQGPVIYWTALHRRHHSFSDLPGDPHSPNVTSWTEPVSKWKAFWRGHFGWATDHAVPLPSRYVPDLLADPLIRKVNESYNWCFLAGILLPTIAGWAWTGNLSGALTGFYFGAALRLTISTQAIWALNSVCHTFGSRPHKTGDFSTNNPWLLPLVFGENWHNNHHGHPTWARFGFGWSQPDPGWWTLTVLKKLGLAWDILGPDRRAAERSA